MPDSVLSGDLPGDALVRAVSLSAGPGNERDIMRAWENHVAGGNLVGSTVRKLIGSSWDRCSTVGVDAHHSRSPVVVAEGALHRLRQQHRLLMEAAASTLAENATLLADARCMLVLSDSAGVVLDIAGPPSTLDAGRDVNLIVGGDWSEPVIGTNAIGTVIATERPVQVHAAEHYCEGVKRWTCSAAPIHDPRDHTLLGVLDVSGPGMSFCRQNLAVALTAARNIEATLVKRLLGERTRLLEACLRARPRDGEGVVVLDHSGCVVFINEEALARMLRGDMGLRLNVGQRLAERGMTPTLEDLAKGLPEEYRREWMRSLGTGDEALGTLLVIPDEPRHSVPAAAASGSSVVSATSAPIDAARGGEVDPFAGIIGDSPRLRSTLARARRLAAGSVPLLIEGETGVGKELFARGVQSASGVANGPLITCNCGALSKELIGSELFGYVKGAFTGASNDGRVGCFELADGGTLCLDEIGEMPMDLQPWLLRVLDEGVVVRLGDHRPRHVNVRLLALTNRDLRAEVAAGRFRQDLYYRIGVTSLSIPPLREREGDVLRLLEHFNVSLSASHGRAPLEFEARTVAALVKHAWPGNVRELRNVVEGLVLMSGAAPVALENLPRELAAGAVSPNATRSDDGGLEASERCTITLAIERTGGNLSLAARQLGISRSTLYRKMDRFGLAKQDVTEV